MVFSSYLIRKVFWQIREATLLALASVSEQLLEIEVCASLDIFVKQIDI